jgi:hypothetical protein
MVDFTPQTNLENISLLNTPSHTNTIVESSPNPYDVAPLQAINPIQTPIEVSDASPTVVRTPTGAVRRSLDPQQVAEFFVSPPTAQSSPAGATTSIAVSDTAIAKTPKSSCQGLPDGVGCNALPRRTSDVLFSLEEDGGRDPHSVVGSGPCFEVAAVPAAGHPSPATSVVPGEPRPAVQLSSPSDSLISMESDNQRRQVTWMNGTSSHENRPNPPILRVRAIRRTEAVGDGCDRTEAPLPLRRGGTSATAAAPGSTPAGVLNSRPLNSAKGKSKSTFFCC